ADGNCQGVVPDLLPAIVASDACTHASELVMSQSLVPGTIVGIGSHEITVTVSDAAGNHSVCSTIVSVVDTAPPVLTCPPDVSAPASLDCQAAVPDLLSIAGVSDNCTSSSRLTKSQNPAPGTWVGLGPHWVTITVA